MAGGGCASQPPPPPVAYKRCPTYGWLPDAEEGEGGCCTLLGADLNRTECAAGADVEACAKEQCAHSPTKVHVWRPENYAHHPFTCCPQD